MEETKIGIKLEEETKAIKKMCEQLGDSIKHEFDKGIEQIDAEEMKEAIDMLKDLYAMKKDIVEACYYKQIMEAMESAEEEGAEDEGRMYYRGQPRSRTSGRFMRRGDGRRRGYEEPMYYTMTPEMYHQYDAEELRDMDREMMGRMYYSGGNSGSSGGNSSSSSGNRGNSQGGNMGGMNSGSRGYSEGGQYSSRMQGESRDSREGKSGQSRKGYMEAKEMGKEKGEKMKELEAYTKELAEDVTEMISGASPEEKNLLKTKMQTLIQKIQ